MFHTYFLGILFCVAGSYGLYDSSSNVVDLTADNFDKLVTNSDDIWIVEFYAPWCGHCRNLVPEYSKAAKALRGIVKVGAVDADQHKSLAGKYGVTGFPTIKTFTGSKHTPFQGQRTAESIVDAALDAAKKKAYSSLGKKGDKDSQHAVSWYKKHYTKKHYKRTRQLHKDNEEIKKGQQKIMKGQQAIEIGQREVKQGQDRIFKGNKLVLEGKFVKKGKIQILKGRQQIIKGQYQINNGRKQIKAWQQHLKRHQLRAGDDHIEQTVAPICEATTTKPSSDVIKNSTFDVLQESVTVAKSRSV